MSEHPLQSSTKLWIESIREYYKNEPNRNNLTQIFMRGYFAGWSEREIASLADKLLENDTLYPLWKDKNE